MPFAFSCPESLQGREQAAPLSRAGSSLGLLFPHGKDATPSTPGAEAGVRAEQLGHYILYLGDLASQAQAHYIRRKQLVTQILRPHPALFKGYKTL